MQAVRKNSVDVGKGYKYASVKLCIQHSLQSAESILAWIFQKKCTFKFNLMALLTQSR